ncbi:MAG: LuxR C-terminal-related transcriptional regulator [Ornithinimicrobium sp.]
MNNTRDVTIIAAPEGILAAGLSAALGSRGWTTLRRDFCDPPDLRRSRSLLVVDDGQGEYARVAAQVREASACVCVGSVRSLPLLIRLAERGSPVLDSAAPFVVLVRLAERALIGTRPLKRPDPEAVNGVRLRMNEADSLRSLTPPETEVLQLLMQGFLAGEIAASTHRSLHTVRSHIKAVLNKLGVTSQVSAIAVAERSGLYSSLTEQRATFVNGNQI